MATINRLSLILVLSALTACGGGGGSDDDAGAGGGGSPGLPSLSIGDATITEGNSGTAILDFSVSLSAATTNDVSADFTTLDGEADDTDFTPISGQITISAGATSTNISIDILGDTVIEPDEAFTVELTNPVNATLSNSVATGTITNDDFPFLSIGSTSLTENDSGVSVMTFDISLDRAGLGEITVDAATSDAAAIAGQDYTAATETLVIAEGDVSVIFSVEVTGDTDIESDEQFVVNLLNASANARIAVDEATGLIINDDFPKVSIGPGGVTEVDSGIRAVAMPIILDAPATDDVTVLVTTTDVSAIGGVDYTTANFTLTIPAGSTNATASIDTLGDTDIESAELFQVILSDLQGPAVLDQPIAAATIIDNDGALPGPMLVPNPSGAFEGDSGTTQMLFLFLLSETLSEDVTFDVATTASTATSGIDYEDVMTSLTISAGSSSILLPVTVYGDSDEEGDEFFSLAITNVSTNVTVALPNIIGNIVDDDTSSPDSPRLSIDNVSVLEGDTGTADLVFTVTLDQPSTTIVTVDFATEDGSALAGADYNPTNGQLSIPIGTTSATIVVSALGDTFSEDDETLRVRLSNISGDAQLDDNFGTGTILTDEPLVRLSIADAGGPEGQTTNSEHVFVVSIDSPALNAVTFIFTTGDDTAVAGEDYIANSGATQISPGDTSANITITVIADEENEPDETYNLALSDVSTNAVATDTMAVGSIVNDDGTPGWQTPTILGGSGDFRNLTMDANGNAAAVFIGATNPSTFENPVLVSRLEGGAWLAPEPVGNIRIDQTRIPSIAMLDNGRIMAAWAGRFNAESAVFTPGGTWIEEEISSEAGFFIDLAGNAAGDAIVAWESLSSNPDPADILRNRYDPVTQAWGNFELGENDDTGLAREPFVTIDDTGNAFVYWFQGFSDPALSGNYYDYYNAVTDAWSGATLIPELDSARNEYLGLLNDGRPAIAAQFGSSVELWAFDPDDASWASLGAIQSSAIGDAVLPEFAQGGDGAIYVAWLQEPTSAEYDAYVNRFDPVTETWGTPVLLENLSGTVNPTTFGLDIAADDNGNAIVVWSQNIAPAGQFDNRIRASRYTASDGLWSPAEQIDNDDLDDTATGPFIEMDSAGNAVVIWYHTGSRETGAARYIAP